MFVKVVGLSDSQENIASICVRFSKNLLYFYRAENFNTVPNTFC